MVKVIQEIVDIVYPYADYEVSAKDRLYKKRSFFSRTAIKIVTKFFRGEKYANKPKEIAEYAEWATRGDGPAIYGIPTPIHCMDSERSCRLYCEF
ncbi:hypothetical protein BJV74DRAFT_789290 [Russula compacta]|nr:hypothetical protein BJV74DRAFT_789290 [Russula compacta]